MSKRNRDRYFVQLLVLREIEVEASDELQAERAGHQALKPFDRERVVMHRVLPAGKDGNDIYSDPRAALKTFEKPDPEWIEGMAL